MSTARDFHHGAMDRAFLADRERQQGNVDEATSLFQQALNMELAAINMLQESGSLGSAVLHRSAGWLAMDCRQPELAKLLAFKGLASEPQPEIAHELEQLLEQARFNQFLEEREIDLSQGEIVFSLVGRVASAGMMLLSDFVSRTTGFQALVYRIVQRNLNLAYTGGIPESIKNGYHALVSPPRSGSFVFSMRLGTSSPQLTLPGFFGSSQVVSEFMDLMDLANRSRMSEIQERIPDPAYRANFLGLAKKLAPDGDRVACVSFTSVDGLGTRSLAVTTPASLLPMPDGPWAPPPGEPIVERGTLRYADAGSGRHSRNQIRIVKDDGSFVTIAVPEGMMDDIVRPLWNLHVTVRGRRSRRGRILRLQEIWESEAGSPATRYSHIRVTGGPDNPGQQSLF